VQKDADVQLDCLDYPKLYLELLVFHAENSVDSTSVHVQR